MSIISLIIKREFIAKVRNKSFIVMTFLSPLLFVAITGFIAYLGSMKPDTKLIAIHDESGLFVNEFMALNNEKGDYKYLDYSRIELQVLKDSITRENYEALLYIPKTTSNKELETKIQLVSNNSLSITFIEKTQGIIADKLTKDNLELVHLDTLAIKKAKAEVILNLSKASGEESL